MLPDRDGVLSAIGGTPLVRLRRFSKDDRLHVYGKLEGTNPGGSVKDRAALAIIEGGLRDGSIGPDTTVIEQSSGNMGVGLAKICRYFGLRFICVVDPKTSPENVRILRSYGAEVETVVQADPQTGEFLPAKFARIETLLREIRPSVWPQQYRNEHNPRAHHITMHEIAAALPRPPDYLFLGVSTCGTLRGCAEYIREHAIGTRIIAVDAVGSRVSGTATARRLLPGLGTAIAPPFYDPTLVHDTVTVSDADCVAGCRWLVHNEAIFAGGSSGGVAVAMHRYRARLPDGATCVLLFADRGERYLDTIYDPHWVKEHLGEIAEL